MGSAEIKLIQHPTATITKSSCFKKVEVGSEFDKNSGANVAEAPPVQGCRRAARRVFKN